MSHPPSDRHQRARVTRAANIRVGLIRARQWRERMRPLFDQMDRDQLFWDSPLRHPLPVVL